MTQKDDALLNTENPIYIRDPLNGNTTGRLNYGQADANNLNVLRSGGQWTPRLWMHNEVCWHRGGSWRALQDTTDEPGGTAGWQAMFGPGGRGEMGITSNNIWPLDIDATWQDIDGYDTSDFSSVGCAVTLATGEFTFSYPGLWMLTFSMSFNHTDSQQGRTTGVRLWDQTAGASATGDGFQIGIGRNVEVTPIAVTLLAPIAIATLGNVYVLQIGGGDTVSAVEVTAQSLGLAQLHYT